MVKQQKIKMLSVVLCAALIVVGMVSNASALNIPFFRLTDNGNGDISSQLSAVAVADGSSRVAFTFYNASGGIASSITDIYFDDGTLLGIASITNGGGVNFASPAVPSNLPGGNLASPPFVTTTGLSADSTAPITANGVNPGESVTITFNLINGKTFADTEAALANGSLRIGLHVQSIGTVGGSDSYINGGDGISLSEPGTMILLGLGLLGLGIVVRKRF
jgi:hypothetical protein